MSLAKAVFGSLSQLGLEILWLMNSPKAVLGVLVQRWSQGTEEKMAASLVLEESDYLWLSAFLLFLSPWN